MAFKIRPATPADAPAISHIGREAFRPSIGNIMFPPRFSHRTVENTASDAEGAPFIDEVTWQIERIVKRLATMVTVVLVDESEKDGHEGEIMGYAHWEVPASSPLSLVSVSVSGDEEKKEEGDNNGSPVPPTFDREASRRIGEEFEIETKRVLGGDGHTNMWYLAVLGVSPDHQRKGVGRKLLQWGMTKAAEENKALFLLASLEGYPLYKSQGFQTLGEFNVCETLPSYSMILPAPQPKSATVEVTVINGES